MVSAGSKTLDLYWSVRSPFCYLAMGRIRNLCADQSVEIRLLPVLPLGLRDPSTHNAHKEVKHRYNFMDAERIATMLGLEFSPPSPDPLSKCSETGEAYAMRLTKLCVAAEMLGVGVPFAHELSKILFSNAGGWRHKLEKSLVLPEFSFEIVRDYLQDNDIEVSDALEHNQKLLSESGHWGVPLMVYEEEPFFGQDRVGVLAWRLRQR